MDKVSLLKTTDEILLFIKNSKIQQQELFNKNWCYGNKQNASIDFFIKCFHQNPKFSTQDSCNDKRIICLNLYPALIGTILHPTREMLEIVVNKNPMYIYEIIFSYKNSSLTYEERDNIGYVCGIALKSLYVPLAQFMSIHQPKFLTSSFFDYIKQVDIEPTRTHIVFMSFGSYKVEHVRLRLHDDYIVQTLYNKWINDNLHVSSGCLA